MKNLIMNLVVLMTALGCTKDYVYDRKQIPDKMVIDGFISTIADSSRVVLSQSSINISSGSSNFIDNAEVLVSDDAGNKITFVHRQNDRGHTGQYFANKGFKGVLGRTYHLVVKYNGKTYEADDQLFPVSKISELKYEEEEDDFFRDFENLKYRVSFYADEPKDQRNYYYVRYYRNGQRAGFPDEVFAFSDEVLNEEIKGYPLRQLFASGDVVLVELMSISENAYKYFADLGKAINNDGGMFSSPGANPVTNISNGALGVFYTSDVSQLEISIE